MLQLASKWGQGKSGQKQALGKKANGDWISALE
jgi:hypothetical protein